ncbi:MAG TPA: DinB family protein [Herpetosiphonaceae bacterium]
MERALLQSLSAYNANANRVALTALAEFDPAALREELPIRESLFGLARHMLEAEGFFLANVSGAGVPADWRPLETVELLLEANERIAAGRAAYLAECAAEALAETLTVTLGPGPVTLSRWQFLLQSLMHSAQHRGELSALLTERGRPLPLEDYIIHAVEERGDRWPFREEPAAD